MTLSCSRRTARRQHRGVTIVVVLLLLTVMLLGGLSLVRMTDTSVLVGGNVATKEAAVHASEVGWNTAFAATKALVNQNANSGTWYWATIQAVDADGIPAVDWDATPKLTVGRYTVTYAVDRQCTTLVPVSPARECLVRRFGDTEVEDRGHDAPGYEDPTVRQFRITVRVTEDAGNRGTQTWMQSLVSTGS